MFDIKPDFLLGDTSSILKLGEGHGLGRMRERKGEAEREHLTVSVAAFNEDKKLYLPTAASVIREHVLTFLVPTNPNTNLGL